MTYDFSLFVPDRTPDGAIDISSRHHFLDDKLIARRAAPTVSTPQLEAVVSLINDSLGKLADLRKPIHLETVAVVGDRTISVHATYPTAGAARTYLMKLALRHGLGLCDDVDASVLLYGDEDPRYRLITPSIKIPATSPTALGHLCDFILDTETANQFFIVEEIKAPQRYIQTCVIDEDTTDKDRGDIQWRVEYREGDANHHFGQDVKGGARVAELMRQWLRADPAFHSEEWEKMEF